MWPGGTVHRAGVLEDRVSYTGRDRGKKKKRKKQKEEKTKKTKDSRGTFKSHDLDVG